MNKKELQQYMLEYLKEKVRLEIINYTLNETALNTTISLSLRESEKEKEITGEGVGLVDAAFNALLKEYSEKFSSLRTISLGDAYFNIDYTEKDKGPTMKSRMKINLEFVNASKTRTSFMEKTTSLSYTAVKSVVRAVQFYINCELLFERLSYLVRDAKARDRGDLESQYCYALAKVVEVTRYKVAEDG